MNKILGATALAVLLGATAAMAQTTSLDSPPASKPDTAEKMAPPAASTTTVTKEGLVLTEAQKANAWIKKAVFSSDGKNVGEVTSLKRDASGKVAELQAGIGGFLGMGETQVRLMPAQFKLENDRVVLSLTTEQVKALPPIAK